MKQAQAKQRSILALTTPIAWSVTLLVSFLPDILFTELTGSLPGWRNDR